MAKRGRRRGGADGAGIGVSEDVQAGSGSGVGSSKSSVAPSEATNDTLAGFAEDLGRLLGSAQSKASAWLEQRKSITDQLTQIRDTANRYLQELTGAGAEVEAAVQRGRRRGRPPGGASAKRGPGRPKGSGKKKRTMSAEARAKIGEAQRKRWAKQKKEAAG